MVGKCDWMLFFDIDEFLMFNQKNMNVKKFLKDEKFDGYDMIHVNWRLYNDNGLIEDDGRGVVERFTQTSPMELRKTYEFPEVRHVKTMIRGGFNPKDVRFDSNPHTPHVPNTMKCCTTDAMDCDANSPFNHKVYYTFAWLAHYNTKTLEEWLTYKVPRRLSRRK